MSDAPNHSDDSTQPPRKSRRRRRWLWLSLLSLIVLLVLLVGLTPMLLSTSAGTRFVLGFVNKPGKLKVSVKQLSLSWLSGQSVTNLDVTVPPRGLHVSVDQLNAPQVNLLPVLFGSRDLGSVAAGDIRIQQTAVASRKPPSGPTQPAAVSKPQPAPSLPKKLKLSFSAKKIVYDQPGTAPITLTHVSSSVDTGQLTQIHLAAQADVEQGGKTGRLDADVKVDHAFSASGNAQWAKATVQASANVSNVPTALFDMFTSGRLNVPMLLGPTLDAAVNASGPIAQMTANVTARSAALSANVKLLHQNAALVAGPGSAVSWTLSPQAFGALAGANQPASLEKPVTFHLALNQLRLPSKPGSTAPDLAAGSIKAHLTAGDILLAMPDGSKVALRSLNSTLQSPRFARQLTAHLTATATAAGTSQPLDLSASVDRPMDLAAARATVTAKDLPVALVDAAAHQSGRLVQTLGPRVTLALTASRKTPSEIPFTAQVSSANLNGPISGMVDMPSRSVTLNTPKPITLAIAPRTLADWFAYAQPGTPARVALLAPATVSLNLKQVEVAAMQTAGPMQLDPDRSKINAELTLPDAKLQNAKTKQRFDVQDAQINLDAPTLKQAVTLIANLKLARGAAGGNSSSAQTPATQPTSGVIESKTQVSDLFDTSGHMTPAAARLQTHVTAKAVPSAVIDAAAGAGGQLADLLGASTSATADVAYQKNHPGTARLNIESDNVAGQVDAALSANDQLSLNKDAQFKINVTPAVTGAMLSKVNPMLAGVRTGSVPMTLTVSKQNFAMPVSHFDWSKVTANANLQAGKLTLEPTGLSGIVMGVLAKLNMVSSQSVYDLALSPVNFKVDHGLLSYDKLALAVAGIDMNFAGNVNLLNQKLNLTLNISGTSKANALSNISLPITGTINKPKIETKALIDAGVKQGILQGLKHFGGKDVQKVLPGIEQLFNGQKQNTTQPKGNGTQPQQQDQSGDALNQLLQQFEKKKKK